eukprot:2684561-Rhodomonas_salina.1
MRKREERASKRDSEQGTVCTCLREGNEVAALQCPRDALFLDISRLRPSQLPTRLRQLLAHPQLFEGAETVPNVRTTQTVFCRHGARRRPEKTRAAGEKIEGGD